MDQCAHITFEVTCSIVCYHAMFPFTPNILIWGEWKHVLGVNENDEGLSFFHIF